MASKIVVNLDTSKELYGVFKCKQNDDLTLEAYIFDNGAAKDLTNCSIVIQAKKADNTYIIQNTDINKLDKKFEANLVRDFTRAPGETKIEIVLTESSKQNTTFSFCLEVVGSVIRGAEESKDLITSLEVMQDAVVEMGKISEETKELIANSGAASKEDFNKVNTQLAEKQNKTDNTLLTTVKNVVGAINEIYNGIKTEIVSRRVRGQNSPDSPAGTFDFANFAGQGKTSNIPIGGVVHHYTDGKTIQIDNVGEGNVMITMVNAHNSERRPDKPTNFFGNGYYFQFMTNNPNTKEVYSHLVIDEKANLFWNGISPTGGISVPTLTSAKDDGGYPAFLIKSSKKHQTLVRFENGNNIAYLLLNKTGNRCDIVSPSDNTDGLQIETKMNGIRLAPANGNVDLINANIRKIYNGLWYNVYPDLFGTTVNRPTDIAGKFGMYYFDMNLNKPLYVNNLGTGWVDAMGNPV